MAVCEIVAAEAIVRYPAYQPARIFALLDQFYPYANANAAFRPAPFIPYLTFAPSAWVFPLKFTGGGYSGGGKLMFDQGNAWVADNFMVGAENQDNRPWSGTLSKFAPNGTPLSPAVTGCRTGGSVVVAAAPVVVRPPVVCGVGYRWHPGYRRCVVL